MAVLAVMLYHAGFGWGQGGFLGVDVFFVLSGYLITGLLIREYQGTERISLRRFYQRRARRLLPALFAVLAAVCLYVVVYLPREAATLRGDVGAALVYVTNWHFIADGQSYFGGTGRPSLLLHLWSLAVEEQFYLIWPLLLIAMLRAGVMWRRVSRTTTLWPIFWATAVMCAVSAGLMARYYSPWADPSRVYYGTDTRAFELLIGACVALLELARRSEARHAATQQRAWPRRRWQWGRSQWEQWRSAFAEVGTGAVFAALICAMALIPSSNPRLYPFGLLALCFAAAVLVRAATSPCAVTAVLSWRPLVWLGERSYGVYLWHWPLFDVTRPGVDVTWPAPVLWAVRFGGTILLAELSFRYLERPIRNGAIGRLTARCREAMRAQRPVLPLATLACTLVFCAGGIGMADALSAAAGKYPANPNAIAIDDGPALMLGTGAGQHSTRKTGAAAGRRLAKNGTRAAGRLLPPIPTTMPAPPTVIPRVAFFGDSQGMTLLLNKPADAERYLDLIDDTTEGCGFLGGEITSRSGERRDLGAGCGRAPRIWAARARAQHPDDAVLMVGGWDEFDEQFASGPAPFASRAWDRYYSQRLGYAVGLLRAAGVPRIELALLPCYRPVPESGSGYWPERGDDWRTRHVNALLMAYAAANPTGLGLLQPPPAFCTNPSLAANRAYRWDGTHYYKPGSLLYFRTAIPQLLAPLNAGAADAGAVGRVDRPGRAAHAALSGTGTD